MKILFSRPKLLPVTFNSRLNSSNSIIIILAGSNLEIKVGKCTWLYIPDEKCFIIIFFEMFSISRFSEVSACHQFLISIILWLLLGENPFLIRNENHSSFFMFNERIVKFNIEKYLHYHPQSFRNAN